MRTLLPNDKLKDPEPEDKTNLAKGAQKKLKVIDVLNLAISLQRKKKSSLISYCSYGH